MISVVISAFDAAASIERCLGALRDATHCGPFELIVVDCSSDKTAEIVERDFPEATLVRAARRLFPGEARNLGFAHATGDVLVFIDAHCVPDRTLLTEVAHAHRAQTPAVGGVIENGNPRAFGGWASYFCYLSKWMPRRERAQVGDLPSECLTIKRWALEAHGPFPEGTYSSATAFSWRLNAAGHSPWVDPNLRVARVDAAPLGHWLRHAPEHSWYYAAVRARESGFSLGRRIAYALGTPLLPLLFFARNARRVVDHRCYRREFVLATPLVFLGYVAMAYGEARGYLAGEVPHRPAVRLA